MFAYIFPGQGSQHPQMGKFLYSEFPEAKHIFEEASDALSLDLKKLCFDGSETDLALTENTQPAILTVSLATAAVLSKKLGLTPTLVAGHSVGEYPALVVAGVLSLKDAVKSVRLRGQAMQSAVPVGKGAMAAVMGLTPEQVQYACQKASAATHSPLSPANYNSPSQIVISGSKEAVDYLQSADTSTWFSDVKRFKLIPLQVSAPFHCELMKPAEDKMRLILEKLSFQDAQIPVVQNFTAKVHRNAKEIRENLIRQVSAPVKWMQSMEEFKKQGQRYCIECGAGKVLQGLLKKIDSEAFQVFNVNNLEDIEILENFLKTSAKGQS